MDRTSDSGDISFLGHPRGLVVLFSTELWERFSYYGMRALLIFYLTQHFLFSDKKAYLIYGAYTALIYLTPVIGGVLADKYLGAKKAVCFGATLLVLGHFCMVIEGPEAINHGSHIERNSFYLQVFYLALALIITGTGFLKANIATIVGSLYKDDDPRRDGGFTLFYIGINLGSFMASILCGWLGQTYGWAYGFGLAGIGMLAGLVIFVKGQPLLKEFSEPVSLTTLNKPLFPGLSTENSIYLGSVFGVLLIWQLIQHQQLVGELLMGFGGLMLFIVMLYSFTQCTPIERDRMLSASLLVGFSVVFWALFEQAGSSLNLFADRAVDRKLLGHEIPASMFQSLNAFFIFTLAPFFSMAWVFMAKKGIEPSTPTKFALALLFVGSGFLVLAFGANQGSGNHLTSMLWLVSIYLLHTVGELCLSPVGLSMITRLCVKRLIGMMMGVWFLANAAANYIAGLIAQVTGAKNSSDPITDASLIIQQYIDVYTNVGLIAIIAASLLLLITPVLKKTMHGIH